MRAPGAVPERDPAQGRLADALGQRGDGPQAAVGRRQVSAPHRDEDAVAGGPEAADRILQRGGDLLELGRVVAVLLEQAGRPQHRVARPEHVRERLLVARLAGDQPRAWSESLRRSDRSARNVSSSWSRPSSRARRGSSGSSSSSAARSAPTRSGSTSPDALWKPRLLASAARARRSPSRLSSAIAAGLEQRLAERRVAGLALGLAEAGQQVAGGERVRRAVSAARAPERTSARLVGRELLERALAGQRGRARSRGRCASPPPSSGARARQARAGVVAADVLERLGDAPVQPRAPRGAELVGERRVHERVGEAEAARACRRDSEISRARTAASRRSSSSSSSTSATRASSSESNLRPITAAIRSRRPTGSPSRWTRRPTTSRTLSGSPTSSSCSVSRQPSSSRDDRACLHQVAQHLGRRRTGCRRSRA